MKTITSRKAGTEKTTGLNTGMMSVETSQAKHAMTGKPGTAFTMEITTSYRKPILTATKPNGPMIKTETSLRKLMPMGVA